MCLSSGESIKSMVLTLLRRLFGLFAPLLLLLPAVASSFVGRESLRGWTIFSTALLSHALSLLFLYLN